MQALEDRDYFTDYSILKDPYSYFEAVRAKGPIYEGPNGYWIVTGFEEALEVLKNSADFSSANCVQGAGMALPFTPRGSDISADIEANRSSFYGGESLVTLDDRRHTMSRALLGRLFTPSRLKSNEEFMTDYADDLVRNAISKGGCELITGIATPFVTLVIADLLAVPADDRQVFMETIAAAPPPGSLDGTDSSDTALHPIEVMAKYFINYVNERRANPTNDVLSELANATFPDGTTPDAMEIVRLSTFLFGAGQDTSAKLIGNTMKFIIEEPGLQDRLRADKTLITPLLEEVLRLEGSSKMTNRVARRDTKIGDKPVPAGTRIMVSLSGANRDGRRWENPGAFTLKRPRNVEHVGFGRGAHVCVGAPLARAELRILFEHFLQHTSKIELDPSAHPNGVKDLSYEESFIIRGLADMHLKLTPSVNFKPLDRPPVGPIFSAPSRATNKAAAGFSSKTTKLSTLMGNPATKAVLVKHFPGIDTDPRIGLAMGMTLRAMQSFSPEQFTSETLNAVDADLASIPNVN